MLRKKETDHACNINSTCGQIVALDPAIAHCTAANLAIKGRCIKKSKKKLTSVSFMGSGSPKLPKMCVFGLENPTFALKSDKITPKCTKGGGSLV